MTHLTKRIKIIKDIGRTIAFRDKDGKTQHLIKDDISDLPIQYAEKLILYKIAREEEMEEYETKKSERDL